MWWLVRQLARSRVDFGTVRATVFVASVLVSSCFYDFSFEGRRNATWMEGCQLDGYRVLVCDDFERTTAMSEQYESRTGSPETLAEHGNRVLSTDPANDAMEWLKASASATTSVTRAVQAFRLRVLDGPDVDYRIISPMTFDLADDMEGRVFLRLYAGGALALVEEIGARAGGNTRTREHPLPPPGSEEHDYRVSVDLALHRIQVEIDGQSQLPADESFPIFADIPVGAPSELFVGAGWAPAATPPEAASVTLHFDDVVFAVAQEPE